VPNTDPLWYVPHHLQTCPIRVLNTPSAHVNKHSAPRTLDLTGSGRLAAALPSGLPAHPVSGMRPTAPTSNRLGKYSDTKEFARGVLTARHARGTWFNAHGRPGTPPYMHTHPIPGLAHPACTPCPALGYSPAVSSGAAPSGLRQCLGSFLGVWWRPWWQQ
jgi:hypothetical protein